MKKLTVLIPLLLAACLIALPFLGACSDEDNSKLKVVTSTSLIAQIVERVGGDNVDVANIIPPAQCPGHFDCSPGDVQKLVDADLFLLHGWQGETFSDELIASADNDKLTSISLNVKVGENMNWMTPDVQSAAVDKITEALVQVDGSNAENYRDAAAAYKKIIDDTAAAVKETLAVIDPASVNVLCSDQQQGFVRWAGFSVVSVFGRPETMTPQVVKDLVDAGRAGNAILVIDNMQSGADAGAGVAEELNCSRVILSNFPGGYDNTPTWEDTIDYNIELLMEALTK